MKWPAIRQLRELNPGMIVHGADDPYLDCYGRPPLQIVAPIGYKWIVVHQNAREEIVTYRLHKLTTKADVQRVLLLAREPWREYFAWRPDDVPPRDGDPVALEKFLLECGEETQSIHFVFDKHHQKGIENETEQTQSRI